MIKRRLLSGLIWLVLFALSVPAFSATPPSPLLRWDSVASDPCLEYFQIQSRDLPNGSPWTTEDQPTVATACTTPDGHSSAAPVSAVTCNWLIPNKNKFFRVRRFFITRNPQGGIVYNALPWIEAPLLQWVCGGPTSGSGTLFPAPATCP